MSTTQNRNAKEEDHRNTVSDMIGKCTDDELRQDMKDTAEAFRQLRNTLLLALSQMKRINADYGMEDNNDSDSAQFIRDAIATNRIDELCIHEMHLSFCEFDDTSAGG